MRYFRIISVVLIIISVIALIVALVVIANRDTTNPVISMSSDKLSVSVSDDKSVLLQGVSAIDKKDGDISDKVYVESISQFTSSGEAIITYAVCDNDNHVTTAKRRLVYTDYESPKFYLKNELRYPTTVNFSVLQDIGCVDVIDGDISDNIVLTSSDIKTRTAGTYDITVQVVNSMGETVSCDFKVTIESAKQFAPSLELNTYLTYVKVGELIDFSGYIKSAKTYAGDELSLENISYPEPNRFYSPGTYVITYRAMSQNAQTSDPENIITTEKNLIIIAEE